MRLTNGPLRNLMLAGGWPALFAVALLGGLTGVFWKFQPDAAAPSVRVSESVMQVHAVQQRKLELDRRFSRGIALLNAQQYGAAARAWHDVLALAPRMPEAQVNMGFTMLGLNRFAAARDFFGVAIDLNKRQMNAYFGLALALEGLGDLDGALGAMRSYIHLTPEDDLYMSKARAAVSRWETAMNKRAAGVSK